MTDDETDTEMADVEVELLSVEPVRNRAHVIAIACAEVRIMGMPIGVNGIRVLRERDGRISIQAPLFKAADGSWRPCLTLPDTTMYAMLGMISEAAFERMGMKVLHS